MTIIYTPDGQTPIDQDYTLPQDVIDDVVVETVNQQFTRAADNIAWMLLAQQHFSPFNFGAVGDGAADDTAPVQAAFDAAGAVGATVNLAGGTFRVTDTLDCYANVPVRDGALVMDQAGGVDYFLSFDDGSSDNWCEWSDVRLSHMQENTLVIYVPNDTIKLSMARCYINAVGTANAALVYMAAGCELVLDDCHVTGPAVSSSACIAAFGTRVTMRGGSFTAATGFAGVLTSGASGTLSLDGVTFNVSAANGCTCVDVAGARVVADGCIFDAGTTSNNIAFASSMPANDAQLIERGSLFIGGSLGGDSAIIPYSFANPLALGSSVDLYPTFVTATSGNTHTVPASYRTYSLRSTDNEPPVVTFDPPLFAGQTMDFLLGNADTDPWSGLIVLAGVSYDDADPALADLGGNSQVFYTARLISVRYAGTLRWVVSDQNQVVLV